MTVTINVANILAEVRKGSGLPARLEYVLQAQEKQDLAQGLAKAVVLYFEENTDADELDPVFHMAIDTLASLCDAEIEVDDGDE